MLKKLFKNRVSKRRRTATGSGSKLRRPAIGPGSKRKLAMGRRPAESLIEVIIALFVVALGSATATSLVVNALQANAFSRDNLVGLNLAVEGVEAMRNIRDINWLKFGFDKANCWNLEPGLGPGDCVAAPSYPQIEEGYYSINLDPDTYSWGLTSISNPLEIDNDLYTATNDQYRLGFIDLDLGFDSDEDGTPTNDPDIYITEDAIIPAGQTQTGTSKFYRMIKIKYLPTGDPATDSKMNVTSTVQWETYGINQVQISTTLTNYQKVKVGP